MMSISAGFLITATNDDDDDQGLGMIGSMAQPAHHRMLTKMSISGFCATSGPKDTQEQKVMMVMMMVT